jgi:hypothetical protein
MFARIALHILVGCLPRAQGGGELPASQPIPTLIAALRRAAGARLPPFVVAESVGAVCPVGPRLGRRFPSALLAVAGAEFVAAPVDFAARGFPRISGISSGLGLALPVFSRSREIDLLPATLSFATRACREPPSCCAGQGTTARPRSATRLAPSGRPIRRSRRSVASVSMSARLAVRFRTRAGRGLNWPGLALQ